MGSDSRPVHRPRVRFNRWQYEPLIILLLPLLAGLSIFVSLFFVALQWRIGNLLARLVVVTVVVVFLFGNAFLFLRRPRRERSP